MDLINKEIKEFVQKQKLGFVATVCPDGTPNLSPKGTTVVWDQNHLVFADISSPQTIINLKHNPSIEINVVDRISRKGYRFKGNASVINSGQLYNEIVKFYTEQGVTSTIQNIALIKVEKLCPIVSPIYDEEKNEQVVKDKWAKYYNSIS